MIKITTVILTSDILGNIKISKLGKHWYCSVRVNGANHIAIKKTVKEIETYITEFENSTQIWDFKDTNPF